MPKWKLPGSSSLDQVLRKGLFEEGLLKVRLKSEEKPGRCSIKSGTAGGIVYAKALRHKKSFRYLRR